MEEKFWKQFENSGRIEDYLSFVNSTGRDLSDGPSMRDTVSWGGVNAGEGLPKREDVYAMGDGHPAGEGMHREI